MTVAKAMVAEEKAFPRGGAAPGGAVPSDPVKLNLFDQKKKKKFRAPKKNVKHHVVTGAEPKLTSLEDLSHKVLTEGMTILGRIKSITDYHLHVTLPGFIEGRVPLTQISEPYSQLLQAMSKSDDNIEALCPLSELFYEGQLVSAYVWQIRKTDDHKHVVMLSLDPRRLHSEWSHTMAKKGIIITSAVKSVEEHGYVMDCGVKGLRSFLKREQAQNYCDMFNGSRPLAVGQLVRCVTNRADTSSVASIIELSADPEDVAKQEEGGCKSIDMQYLLPGMRFKLSIVAPMKEGVKVQFLNMTGFIHHNHIRVSEEPNKLPEIGSTLFGRVLYVTPIVKNVFFSALPHVSNIVTEIPKPSPAEIHYKLGDIVKNAEVVGVGGRGISLRLNRKHQIKAFVPERRIGFNYRGKLEDNEDEASMLQRLRQKFPLKSSVQCRLLHFNIMTDMYICSMEKAVLNEKFLTYSDLNVGDIVTCVVDEVKDGGVALKVGKLTGFTPPAHTADVPLKHPSHKFHAGARVTGRVLKIDAEKCSVIITLKQSLVSSDDPILCSYESAFKGARYTGTVVSIVASGVFVSFFGEVKGFLEHTAKNDPEGQKFFLGQLVECYVKRQKDKNIQLSLVPIVKEEQDKFVSEEVHVGRSYNLEVVSVSGDNLHVKVSDTGEAFNACGIIPILQLSDNREMSKLLFNSYESGEVINNAWCISNKRGKLVVFSTRSSVMQFFMSTEGKLAIGKSLEAVAPGCILPCTVQKVQPDHLLLDVPLPSIKKYVRVSQQQVCGGETIGSLGLVEGQGIQAKVLQLNAEKDHLILSCRRSNLWNGKLESCIMHLSRYLSDQLQLLKHAKKLKKPIGKYNVGEYVNAVVQDRTDWGFTLKLKNGVRGEVTFFNAQSEDLEIGSSVNGKVLHVDCIRGYVELTLHKNILPYLKKKQSGFESGLAIGARLRGSPILVTPEFILIHLKGKLGQHLAYIPTFLYPYGKSELSISEPYFGIERRIVLRSNSTGFAVCLPKELAKTHKLKKESEAKGKLKESKENARYFSHALVDEIKEEPEDENIESEIRIIDDVNYESNESADSSEDEEGEGSDSSTNSKKRKSSAYSDGADDDTSSGPSKKSKKENSVDHVASISNELSCTTNGENLKIKKRKKEDDLNVAEVIEVKNKKKKEKEVKNVKERRNDLSLSSSNGDENPSVVKPTLKNPGFLWDIDPTKFMQVLKPGSNETSSDDDSDENDDQKSKKKKLKKSAVERREAARIEEERLQKVEKELLDPNRQLSSCDDFDRMVLANPNSSAVWLQYMAFHLQATEIEKARAVAQRAIKSISYREEQEKLNVWLGLLNLENLYGTPESVKTTMDQALQFNDPYKIRAHMVRLYAESGKNKELDSEVRLVVKKYKETPGMWEEIGDILMGHGYAEKARSILQQALPSMKSKKDSVSLVIQFALMEARNHNMEQAKALMDPILASYPQRVDVWFTYCDMLIKAKEVNAARELLERAVSQKLPARKMKAFFTKFLQFEEAHGSEENQNRVRSMAADYVKQVAGEEENE